MLDSGVRIAAAFLPAGVPILVGLVVAVLRRHAVPRVSAPAIAGLLLQLLVVVLSTILVGVAGSFDRLGLANDEILTLTSVLGFAVIILQVLSWTLLLIALFRRLPADGDDRTPTGRHALLDAQGEQVVAEEGTSLVPLGAAAGSAGAAAAVGAAAIGGHVAAPSSDVPPAPPVPDDRPRPVEDPADTEAFAPLPEPAAAHPWAGGAHDDEGDTTILAVAPDGTTDRPDRGAQAEEPDGDEAELADPEPELADPEPELADPEPELADPEPELADAEPELADAEPELADAEPDKPDKPDKPELADVETGEAEDAGAEPVDESVDAQASDEHAEAAEAEPVDEPVDEAAAAEPAAAEAAAAEPAAEAIAEAGDAPAGGKPADASLTDDRGVAADTAAEEVAADTAAGEPADEPAHEPAGKSAPRMFHGGHPWFDPDGEGAALRQESETSSAGSSGPR